ncbi:MAG: tyrosine--tRNA ligase, partial [Patescibacteria group bacterium]
AHEIIYPLLQGYDSVVMDVDLEIGGNDQVFNMMMGRQLQKQMNNREKFVLGTPLLVGSDGKKMGKSLNNFVSLTETPENMYGKLMSVVDDIMFEYFLLLTDMPTSEIEALKKALQMGKVHPIDVKKKLAHMITTIYHGEEEANRAADHFEKTVQKKEVESDDVQTVRVEQTEMSLLNLVIVSGVCSSNSEAKRLIEQGGVQKNGEKCIDLSLVIKIGDGSVFKIGKRNFFTFKRK